MTKKRNHTVPKVIQKQFAKSTPDSPDSLKICLLDLEKQKGGYRTTNSTFVVKHFYDEQLEDDLSKYIEDKLGKLITIIIEKTNNPDNKNNIEMTRSEVDFLKKAILVQMVRTPTSLINTVQLLENDLHNDVKLFSTDLKDDEESKDLWYRTIKTIIDKSWSELKHTGTMWLDNLVSVLNCMSPMIVVTKSDLLLSDSGFFKEITNIPITKQSNDPEDYREAFGRELNEAQINRIKNGIAKHVNLFGMPISKNIALIFVDDYWNIHKRMKDHFITVSDVIFSSLQGFLIGSTVKYQDAETKWDYEYGYDLTANHNELDTFKVPVRVVSDSYTDVINLMSLDNTRRIIAFYDIDGVKQSLNFYIKKEHSHRLEFYKKINFEVEYKENLNDNQWMRHDDQQ